MVNPAEKNWDRLSYEYVFQKFAEKGYTLLSETYQNAHQKLRYTCAKHPDVEQEIIYNSLQRGCGCRFCGLIKSGKSRSLKIEKVISETEKHNLVFVSIDSSIKELNSKSYVNYRCNLHPTVLQQMRYNNIQQGFGCPLCYAEKEKKFVFTPDGKTPLRDYVRGHLDEWKELTKKLSGWACVVTGASTYDVHHHYPMELILKEALVNLGLCRKLLAGEYNYQELNAIVTEVQRLHRVYGPGVCLCRLLHKKLHSLYGSRNPITYEQYNLFISEYESAEDRLIRF